MTSADKFGVLFTIVFTAAFIGIAVGLSSDASISDRPGVEQEAFVAKPPPPPPKPVEKEMTPTPPKPVEKEMTPVTPGTTTVSEPEYCWVEDPITGEKLKDGVDNDLDGLIDEPDPLPGMPLGPHPGVDWDYCDLDWYDFSGMNLSDATIRHATTVGTIFRDTILDNAQFGHDPTAYVLVHPYTDATKAFFTNSKGDNVNFERTTLNGANFDTAKMKFGDFNHAGMEKVSMIGAYMPEANFVFSNVIHSDLTNVNLKYSDMTHVNLESTDLTNSLLIEVTLDEGLLVDAWFTDANMKGSTLRNVDGSAGDDTSMRTSSFEGANMQETLICGNFQDSTFEDADLAYATWNDCDPALIDISQLQGTNFHNADFMGVYIPCGMSPCPPPPPETVFVHMITDASTDRSCLHHSFCDLEPIPHGDESAPPPPPPPAPAPPAPTAPMSAIVDMAPGSGAPGCEATDECYIPADVTITIGGTVTWNNVDMAPHTVSSGTAVDGPSGEFDSGLVMVEGAFSYEFDDAGIYDYFCMVHPWMEGTVEVIP